MTKGQTILLTGGALAALGIVYFGFIKKYENGLTWYQDITKDKTDDVATPPGIGANPKPPAPVQSSYKGKNVSDVLLDTQDAKVKGLKVYANVDGVKVVNTDYSPYTVAKKGELLGTFSSSRKTMVGDTLVEIYIGKIPNYVVTSAKMLKF